MDDEGYREPVARRIAHIKSHLENGFKIDQVVGNIERGLGDPRACAMNLARHAEASAMYAWFEGRNLRRMRQWCYVASRLDQMWYQMGDNKHSPGAKMLQLLKPLLSNDDSMIEWFAHYDSGYDMGRVENRKTHDYWAYQAILALRGEWGRLIERCERVLSDPPGASAEQKYLIDHHFYLALARRDLERMNETLRALVAPKALRARVNDESGYTADLISTAAVVYAKIARRHGNNVQVDSPYIPAEWLTSESSGPYETHYDFLR